MTELLKKAFREASKLSPDRQNSFAGFLLAELESEARWDEAFAKSPGLRRAFDALPPRVQEKARGTFHQFSQDPQHPGLDFKQVHPTQPMFSVRVSRGYRALAYRRPDRWVWFWIGSHAKYDNLLKRL